MKMIVAALAALLLITPAAASSATSQCGPGVMTLTEFVSTQLMIFEKEGIKVDPVYMVKPALDKFIAAIKKAIVAKGGDPSLYDASTSQWESLVWAKIEGPGGEKGIGIAVADKEGCVLEADVWSVENFFETMKEAFGADA